MGLAGPSPLPDHLLHDDNHRSHHPPKRYATTSPRHEIVGSASAPSTLAEMILHSDMATVPSPTRARPRGTYQKQGARCGRWRTRLSTSLRLPMNIMTLALLAALFAISPVHGVRIPFDNCLSDSYRLNEPQLLQWVPLYADAVFDTEGKSHNLQVIVWGNVTGSMNKGELPPAGDPYWTNDNETNGKIIREPDNGANAKPLATTLHRRLNMLTYQPWSDLSDFCQDGLNGTCPLSPVFSIDNTTVPYGLPSINITHDLYSSYSFASLTAQFVIIYGDTSATDIGCISATITPPLGDLSWTLKFLPLLVLLFSAFAVAFASIFSPWGSTDIFHWTSNYGRDADLLRLVTPGFSDCLQYIQFVALSGALTLNYPGFYQPMASQVAWSALMFNQSLVSGAPGWQSVVDGIYYTNGSYGLQRLGQLVGMAESQDIWAGMMAWLCVCIACITVLIQLGFMLKWLYRKLMNTSEEDLRSKNIPFSIGNVVRIVFNYFLLPIVSLSTFQLVVASDAPAYTVGLAGLTIVLLIVFAAYLLYLIIRTRPKSVLFDDLPIVLQYGPLYNTYSDEAAAFALIPVLLTFIRGIAIGAVQPSGIAQVVLLAICEVIQILTVHAFRPFASPTSMNAYHTLFSILRLITILLMVAFSPTLGVSEGSKGWIGYVVMGIHGAVLVLGFFLNALQTIVEVIARMLGAGGDDQRGQTRGGLSKIFGMRQLSRREMQRNNGPSRASQLSTAAMLGAEEGNKGGFVMPGGRIRSESAASLGGMVGNHKHRSSSALDSVDMYTGMPRNMDTASSYMPGTPGEASTFSFLPSSPTAARRPPPAIAVDAADPYYRPPRRRRGDLNESISSDKQRGSIADSRRYSQSGGPTGDLGEMGAEISRGATPAPPPAGYSAISMPPNRPDYATREVDFYYGVRGPALNSDGPGRRLGTGPADPNGPVATATGWFRNIFSGKTKEKGKGFEVVRSSRMPPAMMARNGGFAGSETPPEGIPVAMGVLRNGPIDSDDDDDAPRAKAPSKERDVDLLADNDEPRSQSLVEPISPVSGTHTITAAGGANDEVKAPSRAQSRKTKSVAERSMAEQGEVDTPDIPRKSSKRNSALIEHSRAPSLGLNLPSSGLSWTDADSNRTVSRASSQRNPAAAAPPTTSRLPFERTDSDRRLSSYSSLEFPGEFSQVDLHGGREERPASFGMVAQHGISRVDPAHHEVDLLGSSAELVDEHGSRRPSPQRPR